MGILGLGSNTITKEHLISNVIEEMETLKTKLISDFKKEKAITNLVIGDNTQNVLNFENAMEAFGLVLSFKWDEVLSAFEETDGSITFDSKMKELKKGFDAKIEEIVVSHVNSIYEVLFSCDEFVSSVMDDSVNKVDSTVK
ncbi:hypothetical protein KHQ82_00040 [Mycoplasmatota bacterium]|nr:hypothetical protein KHQ82_00040 [Mycoplasmatota bacterium]